MRRRIERGPRRIAKRKAIRELREHTESHRCEMIEKLQPHESSRLPVPVGWLVIGHNSPVEAVDDEAVTNDN
jgi:hypothetical protein